MRINNFYFCCYLFRWNPTILMCFWNPPNSLPPCSIHPFMPTICNGTVCGLSGEDVLHPLLQNTNTHACHMYVAKDTEGVPRSRNKRTVNNTQPVHSHIPFHTCAHTKQYELMLPVMYWLIKSGIYVNSVIVPSNLSK